MPDRPAEEPGLDSRERRVSDEFLTDAFGLPDGAEVYGFGTDGDGWLVKYHVAGES